MWCYGRKYAEDSNVSPRLTRCQCPSRLNSQRSQTAIASPYYGKEYRVLVICVSSLDFKLMASNESSSSSFLQNEQQAGNTGYWFVPFWSDFCTRWWHEKTPPPRPITSNSALRQPEVLFLSDMKIRNAGPSISMSCTISSNVTAAAK